jgi:conjugal transfer mating pair stabilization protein TraG
MINIFIASSSDLTIHTYGGGEILQKVFIAISMLSGDGGIVGPLMCLCAVLGFGFAFCKMIGNLAFDRFITHSLVPFFAIYTIFIVPTTTIHIEDELHKPKIYKVDQVPRLLAHFAEIASSIGYYATCGVEKAMHTVDDVKYSKTGLIFGSETALDFKRYQLTNPDLQKDLREFSKQCVLYDLALGRYSLDELKKSTDIWNFLKERTSTLGMVYYCPPTANNGMQKEQCQYLSCRQALDKFEPLFDQEKAYYAKQEIGKNLPLTFQALTQIKQDSQKLISQQLMMNVLSEQFSSEKFAQERAYLQQNTTYQAAGSLAAKGVVVMRCVFEAVIYASFLFILPLALLPSGIKFLLNWVWLVVWIQFWPPFYGILNYIASIVAVYTTAGVHEGLASKGLSIFTNLGLQNFANDTFALAGYLTLSVPYLSYIILQGGLQQFVQLAGTLTSPAQSAASAAAVEQTSGNYSYDNVSMGQSSYGNMTAFQNNVAPSVSDGYFVENTGYERTDYTSSGVIYNQSASNLTSSINADQVFGESLQHQRQHAESYAETMSQQYQESVAYATNVGSSLISHLAHADNFNEGISTREAYDAQQSVRHMESAADNWGRQFGLSSKQSMDFTLAAAVGGELGVSKMFKSIIGSGINSSGKGTGTYHYGADEGKIMSAAMNFAQSQEFQSNFQKVKDYAATKAVSSSMDEGVRMAQDFTQSLNEVENYQNAYQVAHTQLDQVSDASSWYQQNSHLIKDNLNQKYVDWAVDKFNEQYQDGTGFDRLKELISSSNPTDVCQVQALVYEFVQTEMDKQAGITNPVHYQDPNVAYDNANISRIDRDKKLNEIFEDYSQNAQGINQVYGSTQNHKDNLNKAFEKAEGTQDAYSYFTENEIRYHRTATINQFDIERQKYLHNRAWKATSAREETSKDYEVHVPFFWRRGDDE